MLGVIREVHQSYEVFQKRSTIKPKIPYSARDFLIQSIEANELYAPAVLNLYRKEFLIKNNLRFKKGRFYEDMEFLPRIYLMANKICYLDYPFYNYIIRNESITTSCITKKKTLDAMANYVEWEKLFNSVEDEKLKKKLNGFMFRCYLNSCRIHHYRKGRLLTIIY